MATKCIEYHVTQNQQEYELSERQKHLVKALLSSKLDIGFKYSELPDRGVIFGSYRYSVPAPIPSAYNALKQAKEMVDALPSEIRKLISVDIKIDNEASSQLGTWVYIVEIEHDGWRRAVLYNDKLEGMLRAIGDKLMYAFATQDVKIAYSFVSDSKRT
jgi:uncharacterized membrane protein YkoI